MFTCKEQLCQYLISGHIHLSKKDYGFFSNVKNIIVDKSCITTNQNLLFNKLLKKYQRQITKQNLDVDKLIELGWNVSVLDSREEFLTAYVELLDKKVIIKTPYNKTFINDLRKTRNNNFVWNKQERRYEAPISTYQLKIALQLVSKNFTLTKYCDKILQELSLIKNYEGAKYWQPTLVKIHGNLYILCASEALMNNIQHIELTDDPLTFFELSQYGIDIHQDLVRDEFSKFASNFVTVINTNQLYEFSDWLRKLNVNCVFTSRDLIYNKEIEKNLKTELLNCGIECKPLNRRELRDNSILLNTHSSWSSFPSKNFCKVVQLINLQPVHVK